MFEVGKRYEVRMIIDGVENSMGYTVERYDHPLVKFSDVTFRPRGEHLSGKTIRGPIVNAASSNFVSAVLLDE